MFAQDLTKWHLDFVSPNVAKDVPDQSKLRIIVRHIRKTQYAEIILNKIAKYINKTYAGEKVCVRGA